ncbi:carbohydrate ABC transporter permease [Halanaerobium sp. ST460_2HS_T2]|uniref:carbohydrate ABC transporter permease n=1 Tax=Halanaerobium sp. ST460_2HS_T2 TaxID=2183914 RepID=UPI000DF3ACE5|nr:carbohydrate ABC transporter permease [Halanaerobium sp. ST460_2HS_T2]RCW56519.1 carbohydrate ABC transporter membrane protein 2 (CUT1 family) [Halanaerobium sp. ST460_2HS_T2]
MKKLMNNKYLYSVIAILILILYFAPLYWMFVSGFKPPQDLFEYPPKLIPTNITFEPLQRVFAAGVLRYLRNSFIIAGSSMIFTMIVASFGAYAIARLKARWANWILLFFLVAQMLPPVLMATPLFIIFYNMGLTNTYLAVILANSTLAVPFAVIMLRTIFLQVPKDLEEAAMIDGCTRFQTVIKITFPVAKSGMVVVSVFSFIFAFGDFIYALSMMNQEHMQPATVGLYNFMGSQAIQWNSVMSFASLTALPLIIIFIVLQKRIVQGLSAGAFK